MRARGNGGRSSSSGRGSAGLPAEGCYLDSAMRSSPRRCSFVDACRGQEERYVYHGRVVRHAGWTICQYWFFYAGNNWRSGFHGVNEHESDWEMIAVYLYEADGLLIPE
jgi:hypothetical protein